MPAPAIKMFKGTDSFVSEVEWLFVNSWTLGVSVPAPFTLLTIVPGIFWTGHAFA